MSGDLRVVIAHSREIVARHVEAAVGVDSAVRVTQAAGTEGVSEAMATDLGDTAAAYEGCGGVVRAALDNQMHRG